jgi:flap endonuclease-1
MGIKQLMTLLNDKAADSVRKMPIERYSGQIVACDASMAIYQFVAATIYSNKTGISQLTDSEGNLTAHLVGLLNRTILFLENHIKPVWVFDGKPPTLKEGELNRRKMMKEEAKEKLDIAQEEGKEEDIKKYGQRNLRVSKEMIEDAKKLVRFLGVPVVEAPSEAEAQCANMVKTGKAHAVGSEDMDSLTFGANYLLRGFNSKKEPITEISYVEALQALGLTPNMFIDMCILLGCDYTDHIEGIGPATGYNLIKQYNDIENVINHIKDVKKFKIPENFDYSAARNLFITPEVTDDVQLNWGTCDEPGLTQFLVEEKGFSTTRVATAIEKLKKIHGKPAQLVLEKFFGKATIVKRKSAEVKPAKKLKKK